MLKAIQIAKTVLRWKPHGKLKKEPKRDWIFTGRWTTKEVFSQEKSF